MAIPVPTPKSHVPDPQRAHPDTDRDSIAAAQRGDVGAFEVLYRVHAPRVLALCTRMSADRARGVELMQDVFVRAWERLESFRGEAAFATWLHRLAVNVVLESERSASRRRDRLGEATLTEELADGGAGARMPVDDVRLDLESAIAMLPPGARRAFVLHEIEGYRHAEIARMTGLAEGTVRAQLHQARAILMEALER